MRGHSLAAAASQSSRLDPCTTSLEPPLASFRRRKDRSRRGQSVAVVLAVDPERSIRHRSSRSLYCILGRTRRLDYPDPVTRHMRGESTSVSTALPAPPGRVGRGSRRRRARAHHRSRLRRRPVFTAEACAVRAPAVSALRLRYLRPAPRGRALCIVCPNNCRQFRVQTIPRARRSVETISITLQMRCLWIRFKRDFRLRDPMRSVI